MTAPLNQFGENKHMKKFNIRVFLALAIFSMMAGTASAQFEVLSSGGDCALCLRKAGDTLTGTLAFSGSGKLATSFPIAVGSGTAVGTIDSTYKTFISGSGVGNTADTNNDALWTLTAIPANTFTANGDALVLTLSMKAGATGNNKNLGVTVGGTQVTTANTTANAVSGVVTITISRVDATHVNVFIGAAFANITLGASSINLAVADLTANTLAVVVTGASPTTGAANDMVLYSGTAQFRKN